MSCILNIGLGPSKKWPDGLRSSQVLEAVMQVTSAAYFEFRRDAEEPTVVVLCDDLSASTIYRLSVELGQDCIAWSRPGADVGYGALIGPYSSEWGAFDGTKFLRPRHNVNVTF